MTRSFYFAVGQNLEIPVFLFVCFLVLHFVCVCVFNLIQIYSVHIIVTCNIQLKMVVKSLDTAQEQIRNMQRIFSSLQREFSGER